MAKKADASALNIDAIIDAANKELKLLPSNLARGALVKHAVSTGSLALDLILGGGWAPRRRSNVFGREGAGKTLLLYSAVKSCIAQKIHVVFYDWEGSTDGERINRMGIKHDWAKELRKSEPVYFRYFDRMHSGEQMFAHASAILDGLPDSDGQAVSIAFFLDSLPTVVPKVLAENNEDSSNALRARLYSDKLPVIKSKMSAKGAIWIDTNQLRDKVRAHGNPEYEPCGDAVKSQSDCRIKVKKTIPPKGRGLRELKSYIEEEAGIDGGVDRYNFSNFYVIKNKSFSPFRDCTLRIWFESNGQPLGTLDPVYDVYEYLRLTGQIQYTRKEFIISTAPFNQDRDVVTEVTDDKGNVVADETTGEVKTQVTRRNRWRWHELKQLILDPPNDPDYDIVAMCRRQIQDGSAFTMYFAHLAADKVDKAEEADAA